MRLCLSRRRTLLLLDDLGKSHDEEVIKWRENMKLSINEVKYYITVHCMHVICFPAWLCYSTFHLLRRSDRQSLTFQVQKVAQHFQNLSLHSEELSIHNEESNATIPLLMSQHQKVVHNNCYRGLVSAMNLICGRMLPVQLLQFFIAIVLRLQVHQLILSLQLILQHIQQMNLMMMTWQTMLLHRMILIWPLSQLTNLLVTILTRMSPLLR